jgi:purine-nucleoside phosphorylase
LPAVPAYLRPNGPIAERAVLTGDPGRAMMLAQDLTEQPRMTNHARGLWGYTGTAPDGELLTVQATGIGAPSATAVLRDLAELGLRRAVRVGTCLATDPGLAAGALLAVREAVADDGVSRSLGLAGQTLRPAIDLSEADSVVPALIASHDVEAATGAAPAHDLQTAALVAVAEELELRIGALLLVRETATGGRLDEEEYEAAVKRAGRVAAVALSGSA